MAEYLNDFQVRIPVNGYDQKIAKKVNCFFCSECLNIEKKLYFFYNFQPYLKNLMNELRDFIFTDASSDFDRIDQRIIMDSDLFLTYAIEKWVQKQVQTSTKDTYYHQ